jgi:hypothetical protein
LVHPLARRDTRKTCLRPEKAVVEKGTERSEIASRPESAVDITGLGARCIGLIVATASTNNPALSTFGDSRALTHLVYFHRIDKLPLEVARVLLDAIVESLDITLAEETQDALDQARPSLHLSSRRFISVSTDTIDTFGCRTGGVTVPPMC